MREGRVLMRGPRAKGKGSGAGHQSAADQWTPTAFISRNVELKASATQSRIWFESGGNSSSTDAAPEKPASRTAER